MVVVETVVVVEEMSFVVRAWPSRAADGWCWVARGEDHPFVLESRGPWATAHAATDAAIRQLTRVLV